MGIMRKLFLRMEGLLSRSECSIKGHDWDEELPYSQKCLRDDCKARRILKENRYPKIGEPKYDWQYYDPKKF